MTCGERIVELVECARRGSNAVMDAGLRMHLSICSAMPGAMGSGAPADQSIWNHQKPDGGPPVTREPARGSDAGVFAKAQAHTSASVGLGSGGRGGAVAGYCFLLRKTGARCENRRDRSERGSSSLTADASLSADASALSSDDFIAVPWTPPLAPGEMVRMVHADMRPEALASMGVEVNPLWAGELPVDVVVGEDGLPRAVRIADSSQF